MWKSGLIIGLTFLCSLAAAQQSDAIEEIEEHRAKKKKEFRDKNISPLEAKDRKRFKDLKYYPIDLNYRVTARFVRMDGDLFQMRTTTARLPEYRKFGEVHFKLDSSDYVLEVYQSPDIMKRPGYADYLFIPFTDLTNGDETYDVGRYLELRIPDSEEVIIDFNKCYNPYCSYNAGYSCPIPPAANHLNIYIRAGEKKFKDSH